MPAILDHNVLPDMGRMTARLPLAGSLGSLPASDRGGERAAVMLTLIQTAKLNDIDPQAWLADVLARINDHAIHRLDELLPWNWAAEIEHCKVAA
jgi:IS66 C-terminal element